MQITEDKPNSQVFLYFFFLKENPFPKERELQKKKVLRSRGRFTLFLNKQNLPNSDLCSSSYPDKNL